MTPSQMLKRLPEEKPEVPIKWEPAPRTQPIEVPAGGVSMKDLLFMEQSASLQQGRCPLCYAPVEHEVDKTQIVTFKCTRQPVFHEWRRSLSFLTQD